MPDQPRGEQVRQDGALFLRWQPSKERQDCLEGLGDLINVRHAPDPLQQRAG